MFRKEATRITLSKQEVTDLLVDLNIQSVVQNQRQTLRSSTKVVDNDNFIIDLGNLSPVESSTTKLPNSTRGSTNGRNLKFTSNIND